MRVYGDLTRAFDGSLLELARRIAGACEARQHKLFLIVHEAQQRELEGFDKAEFIVVAQDTGESVIDVVRTQLAQEAKRIAVFTFNAYVLQLTSRLDSGQRGLVSLLKWREIFALSQMSDDGIEAGAWPLATITREEALSALQRVLSGGPAVGTRKTSLRQFLTKQDHRLSSEATRAVP